MQFLEDWTKEFGHHHQNRMNQVLHQIFVPLLTLSVLGILWCIPTPEFFSLIPYLNWATVTCSIGLLFWLAMDLKMAFGMLVQTIVMIWIISKVDNNPNVPLLFVSLFLMAISWGFQMVGHIIEGTHLTLEKNIKFMLIAPIWVLKNLVKSGGEDLSSPQ
ncbi:MAG: DUF962 domain-containing protein [Deltaproteobacteria bacterium]|nr:MAG: DUF962 domain-containing protein [Deltaproteobacteria bacterium]